MLDLGFVEVIERYKEVLWFIIFEVDELKCVLEVLKIEVKEDFGDISMWNFEIDFYLMKVDEEVGKFCKWFEDRRC